MDPLCLPFSSPLRCFWASTALLRVTIICSFYWCIDFLLFFTFPVMSDSLRLRGLQHSRLPCSSPTPGACTDSCPLSQWYWIILSSVSLSPPALNLSQHQGLFQWVSSSLQVAKVLELQLQHQSFQWVFRTDFLYDGLVWSPCCPRDSQKPSPAPWFKSIFSIAIGHSSWGILWMMLLWTF